VRRKIGYTAILFISWQALAWLAAVNLASPWSHTLTIVLSLTFGGAILWLWRNHYHIKISTAHDRVDDALRELNAARQEANKDPLTGLNSRLYMRERLEEAVSIASERDHLCAVLLMDLDFFKDINEALGHQLGNQLLVATAHRLKTLVKKGDLLGYYGGDEYILVLPQINDAMAAELVARRILTALAEPFEVDGRTLTISASLGVCLGPQDGRDAESLIRKAESALARSKSRGRKGYQFFTRAMNDAAAERLKIDQQLRGALERGEFSLVYQPIMHTRGRSLKGMEVLIRWTNPELGRVSPMDFIPIAEQIGAITDLGNWVLQEACAQLQSWQRQYNRPLLMSINVSPRQFHDGSIVPKVKTVLTQLGLKPNSVQLEVTEGLLINASDRVLTDLDTLKLAGVHLALDDFGTGYSSLSYLRHLPFDVLKIDQSFVHEIARKPQDEAMVGAMVRMGHSLGMTVVAEGVETPEQAFSLEALRVDDLQGYYFSQPLSARDFERRFLAGITIDGQALDESIWDRL